MAYQILLRLFLFCSTTEMAWRTGSSFFRLHFLLLSCFYLIAETFTTVAEIDTISWGQPLSRNQTIVSRGGTFELGFFTPGNSTKHYIGIWYKKRPERTVVWVANREKPVSDASSSELLITDDGNLVILDRYETQIWSSNLTTMHHNSTVAVLRESGNLVLLDESDSSVIYWQSFDHPTDTWLPGARLGRSNLTKEYLTLTSWKSRDDPAPGSYSYGLDPNGSDQLVQLWNGSQVYWRSGEWNGLYFSSVPEMTRHKVFTFIYFESEKYLTYSLSDTTIVTRVVAETSGQGNVWGLLNNSAYWILGWSQPSRRCQIYSYCGPFSLCTDNGVPLCNCLRGFEPESVEDWSSGIWSGGCVRKTHLHCRNSSAIRKKDKFLMMPEVQLPLNSAFAGARNAKECELGCLNNCTCNAYAFKGELCSIWNGDLLNLQQPTDDRMNGTIYLRLAPSELPTFRSSKSSLHIEIGLIIGAVGVLFVLGIVVLLIRRRQRGRLTRLFNQSNQESLVLFRYRDLRSMTKNFSERLGGGGFGSVFKGELPDSTIVAVKKLEGLRQGEKQFRAEVSTMGTIQHSNLVRLRGFCCQGDEKLLVYDYMPNGSLDSHLFSNNSEPLRWNERYKITLGTARGLAYLHEECRDCIIHCDIKPENILLDKEFCPKVADFGMAKLMGREISRVLTTMRGTVGYLAPEWISGLPITSKADVYSFGMMLFELISGRRNASQVERRTYFPIWAAKKVADDEILELLDMKLEREANIEELRRVCRVACWCIQDVESDRPPMRVIAQMLEGILDVGVSPIPRVMQQLVYDENSNGIIFVLNSDAVASES